MTLSQKHVNNDFFIESLTQTCFKSYSHPKGNEKNGFCSFPSDKISIFWGNFQQEFSLQSSKSHRSIKN